MIWPAHLTLVPPASVGVPDQSNPALRVFLLLALLFTPGNSSDKSRILLGMVLAADVNPT